MRASIIIRRTRNYSGELPSLIVPGKRIWRARQPRRPDPVLGQILATAAIVAATESITELLVFQGRVRTNNAPLAGGRYRR